jgi:photosystem II stability/assembly factor-like uncharacterized protein
MAISISWRLRTPFLIRALLLGGAAVLCGACDNSKPSPQPPAGDGSIPLPPLRWAAAVGAAGTFAQTFDDVSWATRVIAARALYSVTCVGNYDGWAAGEGGAIAHTVDGGQTWTWQDGRTSISLRAIRFGTAMLGLVVGDEGTLAVTHDGGSTWRTVSPLTAVSLRGAAVAADAGVMVAVGDGGVVLRSSDRGDSWTQSSIAGAADLHGIATDPGAHWLVAVDASGSVWSSSDGGAHFAREASAAAPLDAVAMADDGTRAIAAGARGTVLEREPGGSWAAVQSGTSVDLHAALITGDAGSNHYVAGDFGTLLRSPDRGGSWSSVAIGSNVELYGLDDL